MIFLNELCLGLWRPPEGQGGVQTFPWQRYLQPGKGQEAAGPYKRKVPSPGLQSAFRLCRRSQGKTFKVNVQPVKAALAQ